MKMTNQTYDILKKICLMIAPLVIFISAVTDILGLPWGSAAAAIVAAFGEFMGACLVISSKNYKPDDNEE